MSGESVYLLAAVDPDRREVIRWQTGPRDSMMLRALHYGLPPDGMGVHVVQGALLTCPRCGETAMLPNDEDRPIPSFADWLIPPDGVLCFDCEYDGHCPCGAEVASSWDGYCSTDCEMEART